jgi:hypothetical protein
MIPSIPQAPLWDRHHGERRSSRQLPFFRSR